MLIEPSAARLIDSLGFLFLVVRAEPATKEFMLLNGAILPLPALQMSMPGLIHVAGPVRRDFPVQPSVLAVLVRRILPQASK
jgi:hypothetical protein